MYILLYELNYILSKAINCLQGTLTKWRLTADTSLLYAIQFLKTGNQTLTTLTEHDLVQRKYLRVPVKRLSQSHQICNVNAKTTHAIRSSDGLFYSLILSRYTQSRITSIQAKSLRELKEIKANLTRTKKMLVTFFNILQGLRKDGAAMRQKWKGF